MKNILYTLFVLLLASCYNQNKPKKPENLISKDKMVNIIIDMSLYSSAKGINKRVLEKKGVKLQEHIYEKHKIDSTQFANSNYYYTYNTEAYEDIYQQVKDSLTKLKDSYTAIEKIENKKKKKRDSIKRSKRSKLKDTTKKDILKQPLKSAVSNKNRKTPITDKPN